MSQEKTIVLKRVLSGADTLALSFGAMIGWSWVLLTGKWIESAGTLGAALAFIGGGMVILCVALAYAELAAAMPNAGGEHVYSLRALGVRWSFICSWAMIFGYVSVAAFEAVALPYALIQFFPIIDSGKLWRIAGWDVTVGFVAVGVVAGVLLTWLNIRGVRPAAVVQKIVTIVILITGLAFISGAGLHGDVENFQPLFSDGYRGVFVVLVMVPIMFVGFDVIPQTAEEINLPSKTIGRLVVLSVIAAIIWYALMIVGVALSLDADHRAAAGLTTADASGVVWGRESARSVLIAGGIAGILTSWNAFLIGASRLIYALAKAGQLPQFLADVHPSYGTPYKALWLIGGITLVSPWFGRPILVWLINAGSFGVIIAYVLVSLSFLVLRVREPNMCRPYKLPFGMLLGVIAAVLSLAMTCLFLPGSPAALAWPQEWGICLLWSVLGLYFWRKSCADRQRQR
jgi:basic amino acid/polyamine antiporter, APA family